MSRWIDADALKKDIARLHVLNDEAEIRRTYEYNPHVTATDFEETLVSVFDAIDDAPRIDIVRCGECKYRNYRIDYQMDYCIQHSKVLYTTDGGCSWGKPKEELNGSERLVKGSEKPNNSND